MCSHFVLFVYRIGNKLHALSINFINNNNNYYYSSNFTFSMLTFVSREGWSGLPARATNVITI